MPGRFGRERKRISFGIVPAFVYAATDPDILKKREKPKEPTIDERVREMFKDSDQVFEFYGKKYSAKQVLKGLRKT